MTEKLIQRHSLAGTQEFEIRDDLLRVTTSGPLRRKKALDFVLATLNPDPVLNKDRLEFYGRVRCGPMVSFYVDKPDPDSFNTFVDTLKAKVREEYGAFTGGKDAPDP